jgi:DNA invertase Pin-like site-specific DNA recombinase
LSFLTKWYIIFENNRAGRHALKIGYARTSTTEQVAGLDAQKRDLEGAGCQEIFFEQVSSVQKRGELERLLKFIRKDDCLVVTKLDRLARSIPDLVKIIEAVEVKKASLKILDLNLDTSSPTGKLLLNLIGSIAQFEREIMLQRQKEGISVAKAAGKYRGRAPTARSKAHDVLQMRQAGGTPLEIAQKLQISRASVYRILAEDQKAA